MSDIPPVKLGDVVEAIDAPEEWQCYFDRLSGTIIIVTEHESRYLEDDEELGELPDWQQEAVFRARAALADGDLIDLPSKFEVHEWDVMRRFAESQAGAARVELLKEIHGTGAFRRFRAGLERRNLLKEWYGFREDALKTIAREWLDANGIRYVEA